MRKSTLLLAFLVMSVLVVGCTTQPGSVAPAKPGGAIVIQAVGLEGEEDKPMEAGKAAALALKKAMGATPLKAVIITECLEGKDMKQKVLAGVTSVIDKNIVYGGSTYGAYTQGGAIDLDAVSLLGIGGDGISSPFTGTFFFLPGFGDAKLTGFNASNTSLSPTSLATARIKS